MTLHASGATLDRIVSGVRAHIESELRTLIDELSRAAAEAELAGLARLLDGVRAIDEARTLGDVLDALALSAAHEVDRVALLLVKDGRLRGWRLSGFDEAPGTSILATDDRTIVSEVVRSGLRVDGPPNAEDTNDNQALLPPFARDAGARRAVALPVKVGGVPVAALYADMPYVASPAEHIRWPAVLDILTRHASRALEALTVQQAAGFLATPAARASHEPWRRSGRAASDDRTVVESHQ